MAVEGALVRGPVNLSVPFGETVAVPGTVLRLTLSDVPSDSRCPIDVECVWEGNALTVIGISAGMGPTFPLRLNTTVEPRDATWNGVRITLIGLTPHPVTTGTVGLEEYVAELRVEKA